MEGCRSIARLLLVLVAALSVRVLVARGGYSGFNVPPMFGDYEAQRHWLEITTNLPAREWYHNTTNNDLQYWGLDYPPLTAYHSYMLGQIALHVEPELVQLHTSRGYQSLSSKWFMRCTVLVADLLVRICRYICMIRM
jgi:alpha-1,3-glucosyltransferase